MRDLLHGLVAAALLAPSAAWALPWNVDMVDASTVKAYERAMLPLPEGVRSQPNMLTPISYRQNWTWQSDARLTLTNPLDASDPQVLATGERMWDVYCWPCHGGTEQIGPVGERWPVVPRLLPPAEADAAWDDRLTRLPDGHVYLTIRNGSLSQLMKPYGYAMTDEEIWSIVAWLQTFPSFAPAAAAPSGAVPAGSAAPVDGTPATEGM